MRGGHIVPERDLPLAPNWAMSLCKDGLEVL